MATDKIAVYLSLDLYARRTSGTTASEIWFCLHGHVQRKDAPTYYGALSDGPEGYQRCPSAKASLCEFILQGDSDIALATCDAASDQPVEVNLPSDLDWELQLKLSDGSTRRAPTDTAIGPIEKRSTALAFADAKKSGPDFLNANFGQEVSDTHSQSRDRSKLSSGLPFVALFNINAWQAFHKSATDIVAGSGDSDRVVAFLDLTMTQGTRRVVNSEWFANGLPTGQLILLCQVEDGVYDGQIRYARAAAESIDA